MSSWQATIDDVLGGGEGFEVLGRLQDPRELHKELALLGYQLPLTFLTKKGEWHIRTRKNHAQKLFLQEEGNRTVLPDSAAAYYSRGTEILYMLMAKPGSPVDPSELERNARAISSGVIEENGLVKILLPAVSASVFGSVGFGFGMALSFPLRGVPVIPDIIKGVGALFGLTGGLYISSSVLSYLRSGVVVKMKNPKDYLYGATAAETIGKEVKSRVLNWVAEEAYRALPTQGVAAGKKEFWDALQMLTDKRLMQRQASPGISPKETLNVILERIGDLAGIQMKTGVPLQQLLEVLKPHNDTLVRYGLMLQK